MDRAAGAAAVFGAADAQYAQTSRDPIEHLARRLTDRVKPAAAAGALIARHIERHVLALQMVGKRRAPWCGSGSGLGIARRQHDLTGFRVGDIGVEVLDPEGQLIGIKALGAASELGSLKLFDEALETSDLVVAGLDNDGHVAHQAVQKVDVGGQGLKIETHE